jgi:hypothetical protein
VPYSLSIITLTAFVKIVRSTHQEASKSALSVQNLKLIDIIKTGEDKDKIQKGDVSPVWKRAKVNSLWPAARNPFCSHLPGTPRSLSNIANSGGAGRSETSTGCRRWRCAVIYTAAALFTLLAACHFITHPELRVRCLSGMPCGYARRAVCACQNTCCSSGGTGTRDIASMIHLEFYLFLEHLDATTTLQGVLYNLPPVLRCRRVSCAKA